MLGRLTCALALGLSLAASSAAAEPTKRQLELARNYVEATHMLDTMRTTLTAILPIITLQLGTDLSPDQQTLLNEAADAASTRFFSNYLERILPILAETYTEDEMVQINAFYGSPVGQSMVAKTPVLQARLTPVISEMMPGFQADVQVEFCKRLSCNADLEPLKATEASAAPRG